MPLRLEFQHLAKRYLRSLDFAGEHGFASRQRRKQNVGIGNAGEDTLIPRNGGIGRSNQRKQRAQVERCGRETSFVIGNRQWRLRQTGVGSRARIATSFDDRLSTATPFDDRKVGFCLHQAPLMFTGDYQRLHRYRIGPAPSVARWATALDAATGLPQSSFRKSPVPLTPSIREGSGKQVPTL